MLLPGQGREVGARRGRSTSALLASSFTGCSSCFASSMPVLRCFALVCDDAESKTTAGLDAGAVSSIHSRHPGGGAGHSGEGRQPGGGTQPGGGAGQFGGGLNRYPIPSRSPPLQSRTAPHYPPIDRGTCDYAPAARSTAAQRATRSRAETQVRLMTSDKRALSKSARKAASRSERRVGARVSGPLRVVGRMAFPLTALAG